MNNDVSKMVFCGYKLSALLPPLALQVIFLWPNCSRSACAHIIPDPSLSLPTEAAPLSCPSVKVSGNRPEQIQ